MIKSPFNVHPFGPTVWSDDTSYELSNTAPAFKYEILHEGGRPDFWNQLKLVSQDANEKVVRKMVAQTKQEETDHLNPVALVLSN